MLDKNYLLNTNQMAQFVADGFLRFDDIVPRELCETSHKYIDDGLIFIVDGVTIIDFSQIHYDNRLPANPNVVAFNYDASSVDPNNGIFDINMNGYWESWAGEGNPSLEISSGTIKLMLDTRTGEREDALPYMDQTVPGFVLNPGFQYDCKNGFNLIFGNQNGDGTGSINADLQVNIHLSSAGMIHQKQTTQE